jgi:DNA-binding response OmpR family regulator
MIKNQYSVMIIEDNIELSEQYKLKLEHAGFYVITAPDGEQGLLSAAEERPDVILLDILMPNMDGFEVLRAIKNNTSLNSIIIIVSNLSGPEQFQKAKDLGADDYMVKADVTPSFVVEKVKMLLHLV